MQQTEYCNVLSLWPQVVHGASFGVAAVERAAQLNVGGHREKESARRKALGIHKIHLIADVLIPLEDQKLCAASVLFVLASFELL